MLDLHRIFYLFRKHITVILLLALIGGAAGYGLCSFIIKPTYSASADMIVNNQNKSSTTEALTSSDVNAASSLAATYSIILKSHVVLEHVINELDLPYTYTQLRKNMSVNSVNNTQVMRITVMDKDPNLAMQITESLIRIAPATIMDALDTGSVKTIDNPWTTGNPVSPNLKHGIIFGAGLGFLLCLLFYIIKDMTNHTFRTEEEVTEFTELSVIGIIPIEADK